MANAGHLKTLREGPQAWNSWRARNPAVIPDLTDAAPSVGERQLGPINGGPIDLRSALLQGADLSFATLTGAGLGGADLSGAVLTEARLNGANLTAANLGGAVLDHVDMQDASLADTNLAGASLGGARNLTQEQIAQAKGDARTVLPDGLTSPRHWGEPALEAAPEAGWPDDAAIAFVEAKTKGAPVESRHALDELMAFADAAADRPERRPARGHVIRPLVPVAAPSPARAGMFPTRTMVFATLFLTVAAAVAAWLSTPRPAGIGAVSPESPTVASRGVESSAPAVEPETPARILDTVEPEAARLPATENAEARRLDAPDLPESREQVVTVPQAETAPEAPPVADEASASEAVAHAEPDAVVEEAAPPEKAVEIETGALRDGRESQARKPPGPARVKPAKKVAKPARPKPVQSARATPPRAAAPKPVQSPKATANGRDATTEILSGGL